MADAKRWPALLLHAGRILSRAQEDALAALLDDFSPIAVQDLAELPLPPGGLWDPTYPPPPEAPPAPLAWRVFFASRDDRRNAAAALAGYAEPLQISEEDIADEDWAARSQRALTAVRAGEFIVAPPWDVPDAPEATVIIIEPSRGFGTGHHASTRLCLRALSGCDVRGQRVIDLGTGSGVLAMAASLSGAREVVAVDVDPDAIDSARESARLNPRLDVIHWMVGDFRDPAWDLLSGGPADLVMANLTGGMLGMTAERIVALVRPGGLLITSGFDESEHERVRDAFATLEVTEAFTEEGWVSLRLRRR